MDTAPRFSADADNRVTDAVSGHVTASLTPEAASIIVNSGNAADGLMRCMGSIRVSHEDRGYAVVVTRDDFHVYEV
jgi:hypothetical protein